MVERINSKKPKGKKNDERKKNWKLPRQDLNLAAPQFPPVIKYGF